MGDFRQDAGPDQPAGAAAITLARAAAEAIRGLNHATRDHAAWASRQPPTTSSAPCPRPPPACRS